jgi:predicted MPP superfamily phosphohydrolase
LRALGGRGWLAGATGLAGLGVLAWATLVEHRRLRVVERRVPVPNLPTALAGLRVLHLSDPHVGALHGGAAHLRRATTLAADLIVVTGDLVEGTRAIPLCAELLGRLRAPLGVYAVLGNHDYPYPGQPVDTEALVATLPGHGVRLLRNTATALHWRGETLWLAGVDDPHRWRHDLAATLGAIPAGACTLLLAHSPEILLELPPGAANLVLVGHTHGGQIRLPGLPAPISNTRMWIPYPYGLRRIQGTLVHIHPGMGNIIPLRFGVRPELTLLELVPAPTVAPL